ncbi:MAG: hypothetical protein FWH18_04000 [Marinilabiliaceae bacterium]|nr:hypothetical protein [Marinilabiliaceae bacterium]
MKQKILKLVLCLALLIQTSAMFYSCDLDEEDDETGNDENTEEVYLLVEISDNGGERTVFDYDNENRISKITYYKPNNEVSSEEAFTYNNVRDLVLKSETNYTYNFAGETTYNKNGNRIEIFKNYQTGGYIGEEVELNDDGLPIKYFEEWSDVPYFYRDFSIYQYENGVVMRVDFECERSQMNNTEYEPYGSIAYTYDNKKSPFIHCKTPKWYLIVGNGGYNDDYRSYKNNVLTIERVDNDGKRTTESYTYTYNDDGFPLTRKTTAHNGYEIIETFKYEKK